VRPDVETGQTSLAEDRRGSSVLEAILSVDIPEDDDMDLLNYEPFPNIEGMNINVVILSSLDCSLIGEETPQFNLGPQDAVFKKPELSDDHLKPLFVRGHLDGSPIAHLLIDGGAVVNVMPYVVFKKLGKSDAELIKTNMMINGVRGGEPIPAKGVASMELTIGSKTLPTAFFIADVQGNYSAILGGD
jgi:hypothetical protein